MNDKSCPANDDTFADTGRDSISEPTIPIGDKGDVARAHRDDAGLANGPASTPRPRNEAAEPLATHGGLIDLEPSVEPLDFDDGPMPTDALTQGESVVGADYKDRGPATHLEQSDRTSQD